MVSLIKVREGRSAQDLGQLCVLLYQSAISQRI